ncbi:MAG: methionyl-tRNA formyltransferase [Caldisericaceae bacterium]
MRYAFFSGSEISIPFLEAILNEVVLIVTLPPRVKGRGSKKTDNPLKTFANSKQIDVIEVEKFSNEINQKILSYNLDAIVVFAFGKIIPDEIINNVHCPLNIHPSDLPLYRGASPIERQLLDGVEESAVTIIKISNQLDAGSIIFKEKFKVTLFDDYFSFLRKVYDIGITLLKDALKCCSESRCIPIPQSGQATKANKIKKEEEIIDFNLVALSVHNKVRAFTRIGAYAKFRNKILKIFKTEPILNFEHFETPGKIVKIEKDFFVVSCGVGAVKVLEVQLEGKKRVPSKDFINGYKLKEGEILNENCSPC